MARYTEHQRGQLDQTVHRWKSQCLLGDEPLVFADFPGLWSVDRLQELHRLFNDNPLAGEAAGGRFFTKLDEQLATASVEVRLLTAEAMLVHLLFSSAMTTAGKRRTIERTMQGSEVSLPTSVDAALGEGIGDPGMRFNLRRDLQLGYFIEFALRLKQQPLDDRIELLETPGNSGTSPTTPDGRPTRCDTSFCTCCSPTTSSGSPAEHTNARSPKPSPGSSTPTHPLTSTNDSSQSASVYRPFCPTATPTTAAAPSTSIISRCTLYGAPRHLDRVTG
ncbi:hypothetical protein AB0F85_07235 [Nocardia fluminea]|uniref:hypothetical protein n=1 Tax=Nocardia fluminea TaxID=134984 RepID=UPI0033FADA28